MLWWKEGRGQKVEERRVSSKNDLILYTNDATGHDIKQKSIVKTVKIFTLGGKNIKIDYSN